MNIPTCLIEMSIALQVSPKYPDFKRKDGSVALWLGKAPKWVLPKIEGLETDAQSCKGKIAKEQNG